MRVPHLCPRCMGDWLAISTCAVCKGKGILWEPERESGYEPYPVPYGIPYMVRDTTPTWAVSTVEEEYKRWRLYADL